MNSAFMAFASDDASVDILKRLAERLGHGDDAVQRGGADSLAAMLEAEKAPKLLIVDLEGQEDAGRMAARLVGLCGKETRLIGLGTVNDVSYYRQIVGAGFADYLVKPLNIDTLMGAVRQAQSDSAGTEEAKIVVFVGARGGVGTTTVAANEAWIMAHEMGRKTVLVDMDLQFGNTALALDLEPGRGLRDVVGSPQRVDALMIAGALVPESEKLSLMGAEESLDEFIHIDGTAITALMRELKISHRCVIVDLPRHLLMTQKKLLGMAQEIVIVTEMSLVGIRDTLRIEALIKGAGSGARISVIAGKTGATRPAAVDEAAFTKGTKRKVDFIIPDDYKNVTAANNAGKMLAAVAASAPVTKTLRDFARYLIGQPEKEASKSGKGFFSLFHKEA